MVGFEHKNTWYGPAYGPCLYHLRYVEAYIAVLDVINAE
jgi:hypothetical protein